MRYTVRNGGKGSAQRSVDKKKFDENYDRIFSKKTDEQKVNVGTKGHIDHGGQ